MTSNQTNIEIQKILDKYLSRTDQFKLFAELMEVKGNKSFRDSIANLYRIIKQKFEE